MKTDLFSRQAADYAQFRPSYPIELFDFIKKNISESNVAWDVATGNGQAAVELSNFFDQVHATDLSEAQLKHAIQKPNISYRKEFAEQSSLHDNSVNLITVATAIHWFDKEKFYLEADRVLKKDGILFAWSYGGCQINAEVDDVMNHFNFEFLVDYWHDGAKSNWRDRYQSLHLPFHPIETPEFTSRKLYNVYQVMNYMFSWSGVQKYIQIKGDNPIKLIEKKLIEVWGDPLHVKEVKWRLHSKCSRK